MTSLYCSISDEVFSLFPGYVRGVVVALGIANGESPLELVQLLRDAEESLRQRLNADSLNDDARISSWREAYRAMGAKPSKFRPSMEAMARRVLRKEEIPSINALVDIGNVISLRRLIPVGGHAIDVLKEDMMLRPATGNEDFVPFGSDQVEHPLPREIIFVEGKTVLTRRWTWRQSNHTLLLHSSTAMEMNVDGLPPVPVSEVDAACQEAIEMIQRFCGGNTRYEILSSANPRIKMM